MIEIHETERGNTLLVNDDGAMVAWVGESGNYLQIAHTPGNYPALTVDTSRATDAELLDHIHRNLEGWRVMKDNLKGGPINVNEHGLVADA